MIVGTEWLIEAYACDISLLRDESVIQRILSTVISDLGLRTVGSVWHKFPGEGGVTGMIALTESHLACHTYPEHGIATFNLYCCRDRAEWDWESKLRSMLGASSVLIHRVDRGERQYETAGGEA